MRGPISSTAGGNSGSAARPFLRQKIVLPEPLNDKYYTQLVEKSASKSASHQRKFLARKDRVPTDFEHTSLFQSDLSDYAAMVVSPTLAFLHIWKCGGTTVANWVGKVYDLQDSEIQKPLAGLEIQKRKWVTTVRDPIDRFLSAWAECGFRELNNEETGEYSKLGHHSVLHWTEGEYDFRVRAFLNELKAFTFPEPQSSCHTHAHPQANSMMDGNGKIDSHIVMVGDLAEIGSVMEIAAMSEFAVEQTARNAADNKIKSEYFPPKRNELRDATMLELCAYYALDYYLFDFEAPEICVQAGGPLERFF